jgi:LPPG:FO 2-phospho-L-lactate transferase
MADACLRAIGVDPTAAAVAEHYGARGTGGLLDGWVHEQGDEPPVGIARTAATATVMDTDPAAEALARTAVELVR